MALDSNMATWNAYGNQYWPAEYLLDKNGIVRHTHFGEGESDQTEQEIRDLLKDAGHTVAAAGAAGINPGISNDAQNQTLELDAAAPRGFDIPDAVPDKVADYKDPGPGRRAGPAVRGMQRRARQLPGDGAAAGPLLGGPQPRRRGPDDHPGVLLVTGLHQSLSGYLVQPLTVR